MQTSNTNLPSKRLWANLKKFNVWSKSTAQCNFDPHTMNTAFCSSANPGSNYPFDPIEQLITTTSFQFSHVSETDVANCILKIKSNAVGVDGMPIRFVKLILPYILSPITHIINHCITTSTFPQLWKMGSITPVAKKANAATPADFRPIAILPCLSKVFEMSLAQQITKYIEDHSLLSPLQSGFRPHRSCATATMKILDDIRTPFDDASVTLLCSLDFSRAFDTVNHDLLCIKLGTYYGFCDSSVKLMRCYLENRKQRVKVGTEVSNFCHVLEGVPQGSIMGPLLFCLFVNDIFYVTKDVNLHAYADDIQVYISRRVGLLDDLCCRLNDDLSRILQWARCNGLSLNPLKCSVLPISRNPINFGDIPPVFVGSTQLKLQDKTKSLGFTLNSSLTAASHISQVTKSMYFVLRTLRRSAEFTPQETRRKLVLQLMVPLISYFAEVFCTLDAHSLNKLQMAVNCATRYVFGLRRFDRLGHHRNKILGCTVKCFLKYRSCVFLFKLIKSKSPEYLFDKLVFSQSSRTMNLIVPRCTYTASTRLFFTSTARAWNSLPRSLKNNVSVDKFKIALHDFLFNL